jgi:hypothetical protein
MSVVFEGIVIWYVPICIGGVADWEHVIVDPFGIDDGSAAATCM